MQRNANSNNTNNTHIVNFFLGLQSFLHLPSLHRHSLVRPSLCNLCNVHFSLVRHFTCDEYLGNSTGKQ